METTGSKLTNLTDTELVRLALEQNQAAYIVLYTRYNAGVKATYPGMSPRRRTSKTSAWKASRRHSAR